MSEERRLVCLYTFRNFVEAASTVSYCAVWSTISHTQLRSCCSWPGTDRGPSVLSRPGQGSCHSYTQTGTCTCTRTHKGTSHLCYRFPALACKTGQINARARSADKLEDSHKCTPYYVTTKTSQFSPKNSKYVPFPDPRTWPNQCTVRGQATTPP